MVPSIVLYSRFLVVFEQKRTFSASKMSKMIIFRQLLRLHFIGKVPFFHTVYQYFYYRNDNFWGFC